jgi:hypothetical protein
MRTTEKHAQLRFATARMDWEAVVAWILILAALAAFWIGVAYGLWRLTR